MISIGTEERGNKQTSADNQVYYIGEIIQNTPEESRRFEKTCCHSASSGKHSANSVCEELSNEYNNTNNNNDRIT